MKPQDELFWARLDGEMPPAAAGQYDRSLTPEGCDRMGAELGLERRLGEMLGRPAPGADEAWRTALARVKEHEQTRRTLVRRHRLAWVAVPAAVAAMALVMLSVGYFRTAGPQPWYLSVGARDAAVQATPSQALEVAATARNLLRGRDMHMAFDPKKSLESADAPYRLVSVRGDERAGEPVVEMVFLCGGKPAKVIITSGSGNAAHEIGQATAHGAALASRSVGDWLITAVGTNAPDGLLSLIEEAQPEPQDQSSTSATETSPTETVTSEIAVTAPETAPEPGEVVPEAAVVPETAIAAPQPAPEVAPAAPETPVAPETAPDPLASPPSEKPEPTKTMV